MSINELIKELIAACVAFTLRQPKVYSMSVCFHIYIPATSTKCPTSLMYKLCIGSKNIIIFNLL